MRVDEDAPHRMGRGRRRRIGVWSALAALVLALAPALPASAVDFGFTPITGVTLTPAVLSDAGTGRVDFTWVAPAGAAPGDTFSITLPPELEPVGTRDIRLVDADTDELAVLGSWSGKVATFTFQSYMATHSGVNGTGFFHVKWDQSVVGEPGQVFNDLEIAGQGLPPITKGPGGPGAPAATERDVAKIGAWTNSLQETFTWSLYFPGSNTESLAGPVVVTDVTPPDPGYEYDCDEAHLRLDVGGWPADPANRFFYEPADGPGVTAYSCSTTSVSLTLTGIDAGDYYTLVLPITVVDPDRGEFTNTATFTWPGQNNQPVVIPAEVRRDDAGGTVVGVAAEGSVSVGDYVWEDRDTDGVQDAGEPGIPGVVITLCHVDAQGNRTPMSLTATTDANGLYLFSGLPTLLAGEAYCTEIDLSQPALAAFVPTTSGMGTLTTDSSAKETFAVTFVDLTVDGASDLSLDYGFVRATLTELPPSGLGASVGWFGLLGAAAVGGGFWMLRRTRRFV